MKGIALFFCLGVLLCLQNARALQVDYMDSYKTGIYLDPPYSGYSSSGILKSHRGFSYTNYFNKTFNVTARLGYSLLISIRLIDLRPRNQDQLLIFATSGQEKTMIFRNDRYSKSRQFYPKEEITFFAPKGQVGIRFTTGGEPFTMGYDGFELIYTAVGTGFLCSSDNFHCMNGRCIADDLRCDDHNHCGDQSSLKNCYSGGSGRKVGIAAGTVCLAIAAACGIFIVIRKARRGATDTHTIITSHPPPTNIQSHPPAYPPAYPQPGTYYPPPPPPYSQGQGVVNPTYH